MVLGITPGSSESNYVWFSKEDIEEAEKDLNDLKEGKSNSGI